MRCPLCKHRTEVLETRPVDGRTRRRRRCLSTSCLHVFTTHEIQDTAVTYDDQVPMWLSRLASGAKLDRDALMDSVQVQRRRARINERLNAEARHEADVLREAGLDEQADEIEREIARRQREEY